MSQEELMVVVQDVCEYHGLTRKQLLDPHRKSHWQAAARADLCRRLYHNTDIPLKRIASLAGYGRDHTAVVHWTTGRGKDRYRG